MVGKEGVDLHPGLVIFDESTFGKNIEVGAEGAAASFGVEMDDG